MKVFNLCLSLSLIVAETALLAVPAPAQRNQDPEAYYRSPSSMHGKTVLIPVGTTLEGRIDSTIGSSVSQPGERFTITMASPVLANGVDVIIPSGSQIMGEVVEAIPSSKLARPKGAPQPSGKLRIQLTGLRTPDGMTYPMVASLTGETVVMGQKVMANPDLGGGVAYMGTAAGFEAVAPGMQDRNRGRGGRGPRVVSQRELQRDPIYGAMSGLGARSRASYGTPMIRALVRRKHDLYIDAGSPLSVKLDAPFKIGINPTGSAGQAMPDLDTGTAPGGFDGGDGGKRFSRTRNAPQAPSLPPPDFNAGGAPPSFGQSGGAAPEASAPSLPPPQAQPSFPPPQAQPTFPPPQQSPVPDNSF